MSLFLKDDSIQIREVWNDNLHEEMDLIRQVVDDFPYVAMDTEFPGIVVRPVGTFKSNADYHYETLKLNVNILSIIQLGLTFSNEQGNLPTCGTDKYCIWQFNFREFDLDSDIFAVDSIDLLKQSGIDFAKNTQEGIESNRFAELLMSSGIVLNENVHWVTFHSGYDFGYLLKLLTCQDLPDSQTGFFQLINVYFPMVYDIKHLMKFCNSLHGGLNKLAELLEVERVGICHQAGSDSLLTSCTFRKLKENFFAGPLQKYAGVLYGLGVENAQEREKHNTHFHSRERKKKQRRLIRVLMAMAVSGAVLSGLGSSFLAGGKRSAAALGNAGARRVGRKTLIVAAAAAQPKKSWIPAVKGGGNFLDPEWLDGSLPGDFGFDPLGLGKDPAFLKWYREAELIHGRWAMAAVLGIFVGQAWSGVPWFEAGADPRAIAPFSFGTLLGTQLLLMGWVESKRWVDFFNPDSQSVEWATPWSRTAENFANYTGDQGYPGGRFFDPLGLAGKSRDGVYEPDREKLERLKLAEIKHSRLAMLAMLIFYFEAGQGKTPLGALGL